MGDESSHLDFETGAGQGAQEWSLFFAGDCVLEQADRSIVDGALADRITEADISVANLEAPVERPDTEPIPKSGPALATALGTPARLADAGLDVLTLANNHMMDYGASGLDETKTACATAGLATTGTGNDRSAAFQPVSIDIGPVTVAILSVCEREFGVATRTEPGTAWSDHPAALDAIRDADAAADVVIVVAHGGVEYVPLPPPARRRRLQEFADTGADLIVGHHPHVAQGWQIHTDTPIFYSLGNFAFDRQSDGANTSRGLAIEVTGVDDTISGIDLIPIVVEDTVRELTGDTQTRFREYIYQSTCLLDDKSRYEAHWQEVAVRLFYERYSNWLHTGLGENRVRARSNPNDPDAQRPLWNPDRRQAELLTLLNVVRNESHRAVITTALETFAGTRPDTRTDAVSVTVDELLEWTAR